MHACMAFVDNGSIRAPVLGYAREVFSRGAPAGGPGWGGGGRGNTACVQVGS